MRAVDALFAVKPRAISRTTPVFLLEVLLTGPGFDQCAVHREVFIGQKALSRRQHAREKQTRHILVQQPFPILAEHRMVPHRLIDLQAREPAEQQVIRQLLYQQPFTANRV